MLMAAPPVFWVQKVAGTSMVRRSGSDRPLRGSPGGDAARGTGGDITNSPPPPGGFGFAGETLPPGGLAAPAGIEATETIRTIAARPQSHPTRHRPGSPWARANHNDTESPGRRITRVKTRTDSFLDGNHLRKCIRWTPGGHRRFLGDWGKSRIAFRDSRTNILKRRMPFLRCRATRLFDRTRIPHCGGLPRDSAPDPARGRKGSDRRLHRRTELAHCSWLRFRRPDLLQREKHREHPDHSRWEPPPDPVHHVAEYGPVGGTRAPGPRPGSRFSFDAVRVRVSDLHQLDEQHDVQSHPANPCEREHGHLLLRDPAASGPKWGDEPQWRCDRVRTGQDVVRGRRRKRESSPVPRPDEPDGGGASDEHGRVATTGQPVLRKPELESTRLYVRTPEHVRPCLPSCYRSRVCDGERAELQRRGQPDHSRE